MRVGVIGTGFGARVVAPAFAATPGCQVVDVVSPRDPLAVERLCRRPDVDLVSIHSPPFCHAADVGLALKGGHAVLCDKPLGLDATEARAMLHEAAAAGVVHLVNFEFRHDPARLRLRALIEAGAVGRPEQLHWTHLSRAWRGHSPGAWQFDRATGGGWVRAWGSHAVDTIRWLFGEIDHDHVAVTLDRILGHGDAEDGFTATLATATRLRAFLTATGAAGATLAPRMAVSGPDGVIECVGDRRITVRRPDGTTEEAIEGDGHDHHDAAMRAWAAAIRDAVDDHAPTGPTFADGVACAEVVDRLRG
jgi:predicted dehydrogenase